MLQFPTDAITKHIDIPANGTNVEILPAQDRTILHFNFGSDPTKAMKVWMYCGTNTVPNEMIETHGQSIIDTPVSMFCADRIAYTLTGFGGQGGHLLLTYVDRNVSSSQALSPEEIRVFQDYNTALQVKVVDQSYNNVYVSSIAYSDFVYMYIIFLAAVFFIARGIIKMFYGGK